MNKLYLHAYMKPMLFFLLLVSTNCTAQSFSKKVETWRNNYIAEHLQEPHSPIKYQQVKFLEFYTPNEKYKVVAQVELIKDKKGFEMLTHSGKKKKYKTYAKLIFEINDTTQVLYIYQSVRLMKQEEYKDYLFLPFTDATNYAATFGGGRYLDFEIGDIKNNQLVIDFNLTYNPYCAYAGGFNCPIPPKENRLDIAIKAGEKLWKGKVVTHK